MVERTRGCRLSAERMRALRECTDNYGVGDVTEDWPNNVLSTGTVAYACGAMYRPGEPPVVHDHSTDEFALCERLATEAAGTMAGFPGGLPSEADVCFAPFFVVASRGGFAAKSVDDDTIRTAFGGAIQPEAVIRIEPVDEDTNWWPRIEDDCENDEDIGSWRGMVSWFRSQSEIEQTSFVAIGDAGDRGVSGCVFPRLSLGVTTAGSLAGIAAFVVRS